MSTTDQGTSGIARDAASPVEVIDLGRMAYGEALAQQRAHHDVVLGWRGHSGGDESGPAASPAASPAVGRVLIVEHDPVITISRRPGVAANLLVSPELLAQHGIETHETDRGGDITYHGPGQIVIYPIIDLKRTGIRVVEYVRLLEQVVIDTIAEFGIAGERDADATGVWVASRTDDPEAERAKVAAIGVRVRKWVTMHGLALNVRTDLSHFGFIVPCGLAGRPVTTLERLLGDECPSQNDIAEKLVTHIERLLPDSGSYQS